MIADFNCQPREIDTIDDLDEPLYVHGGIYETSKQSMKKIFTKLNEENQHRPIAKIILTGHSLGGACALAARFIVLEQAELQATASHNAKRAARHLAFSPKFRIVTFGAPLIFSHGGGNEDNVEKILQHRCMKALAVLLRTDPSPPPPPEHALQHPATIASPCRAARPFRPTCMRRSTLHLTSYDQQHTTLHLISLSTLV